MPVTLRRAVQTLRAALDQLAAGRAGTLEIVRRTDGKVWEVEAVRRVRRPMLRDAWRKDHRPAEVEVLDVRAPGERRTFEVDWRPSLEALYFPRWRA